MIPLVFAALLAGCGARQGEICFAPDGNQAEARDCGSGLTCDLHTDASGTTTGRCVPREHMPETPGQDDCGVDSNGRPRSCDERP
ncbi:MAG: hypothetical protein U0359_23860 [Byssovorax sp.]